MEVKPKTIESKKKAATKIEDDEKKKTNKDDDQMLTTSKGRDQNQITLIKGNLKIFETLRRATKTRDDQSSKSSSKPPSSSSSSSWIKMGNYKNSVQRSEDTKKMELHQDPKKVMNLKQNTEETNLQKMMTKKKVWDCESTLYDSFELNSFNRQLDSAISSSARSMSMPHLPPPPPPSETTSSSKVKKQSGSNKISRSLQKLIKSMFRHNKHVQSGSNTSSSSFKSSHSHGVDMDKYYVVFDKTGSLTTIPESGETTTEMENTNSLSRKTVSERFPPSRLAGISCS